MMDANEKLHVEWIGIGPARRGSFVTPRHAEGGRGQHHLARHRAPGDVARARPQSAHAKDKDSDRVVVELRPFLGDFLGWSDEFVVSGADIPASLRVSLERKRSAGTGARGEVGRRGQRLRPPRRRGRHRRRRSRCGLPTTSGGRRAPTSASSASSARPAFTSACSHNGKVFRSSTRPRARTAGWVTFRLNEMLSVDGRPLLGAFHMLLNERRLLSLDGDKRLAGLLKASREYQSTVSNALREQVLSALRALLVGFQNADRLADGVILGDYRRGHLDEVYKGLVTVLMRSVFVLFAEERNLLPIDRELYAQSYSLTRLYAQLVEDRDRFGDTSRIATAPGQGSSRSSAVLHDGVKAADGLFIPPRRGDFFDPDAFPFLEGRGTRERPAERHGRRARAARSPPGERRGGVPRSRSAPRAGRRAAPVQGLDVEQIGSVYEGLMGFEVEVAEGDSLAVMPEHVVVNLEALVALPGAERVKQLKAEANLDLKDKAATEVKVATTVAGLQAALGRRASARQPGLIPAGSFYLQRVRSGGRRGRTTRRSR